MQLECGAWAHTLSKIRLFVFPRTPCLALADPERGREILGDAIPRRKGVYPTKESAASRGIEPGKGVVI
jgi:hypothetical protein